MQMRQKLWTKILTMPTVEQYSISENQQWTYDIVFFLQDIPAPLSRPDDSEYQEFRNFLAVTETGPQEKDEQQVCRQKCQPPGCYLV